MGEFIQNMFEAQMLWNNDSTFFYITGRDVVAIMIGILMGAIFVLFVEMLKSLEEEHKKGKKK
jgi:uncharacterized membrane protein